MTTTSISDTFPPLACVILAAGQGTRMRSCLPKVLHQVAGLPMISHVLNACVELDPARVIAVLAPDAGAVWDAVTPHSFVIQQKPLGTGDAVKAARDELKGFSGDILVLFGDTPLVTAETLQSLRQKRADTGSSIVVSGFTPSDPTAYGRLVIDTQNNLHAIVEAKDATPEQRAITICNGGIMLFESGVLWPLLDELRDDNAKREFYLTDCIKLSREAGLFCSVVETPADDVMGVNTRVELAEAERIMQRRLCEQAMLNGATMLDPATVHLSADTKIGSDVVIGQHVVIGPGVEIADKVEIRAFCHLEQVKIGTGAVIGPFARLRPGSTIGANAHIGNFVEIKNTEVGEGAKINHLSYIGDASVGEKSNIGAGTITCNYNGFRKLRTNIGAGAFIGSNSALVAPVSIGSGSYVGAGSVITMDVPPNTLAVARGHQTNIEDWAERYRSAQRKDLKTP